MEKTKKYKKGEKQNFVLCVFQHKGLKKPKTPQRCEGFGELKPSGVLKGLELLYGRFCLLQNLVGRKLKIW